MNKVSLSVKYNLDYFIDLNEYIVFHTSDNTIKPDTEYVIGE